MEYKYSDRMDRVKASEIREFMAVAKKPDIISFAGGMPAPELFPVESIVKAVNAAIEEDPVEVLQYSTTEGLGRLREQIAERMRRVNSVDASADDILILAGSQEGLTISSQIFLSKDDIVLLEEPSYLGAINSFNLCEPRFMTVPTDDDGMIIEDLEKILAENDRVKMIYVIPTFQNPSGKTWSLERRKQFMEVVNRYEIPVVEDNPYGDLRYAGEPVPPLKAFDTKGLVLYLGSFSKVLVPGFRLGWVCASKEIIEKFNLVKQALSTQSSSASMMIAAKWLEQNDLDEHIKGLCATYKERKELMVNTMKEELSDKCKFTDPDGGIFTWVVLPEGADAKELSWICLEKKVAFVTGTGFYPDGGHKNTLRLNFSNSTNEKIVEGMKIFCKVVNDYIADKNL